MKSIKPGRGPSGMNFMGSVIGVLFGIFWTAMAATIIPREAGIIAVVFPLFGVLFVIVGIVQAVYHYKNFTGKNRMSELDITEQGEEPNPWEKDRQPDRPAQGERDGKYCPYCGTALSEDFRYCPSCGRELPR